MEVEAYGHRYTKCTGKTQCPGFRYSSNDSPPKCMTASVCRKYYDGYPYTALEQCISTPPENKNEFEEVNEAYACKANTYLFHGEASMRCYTRQDCPGFIDYDTFCEPREKCDLYWYENGNERECMNSEQCEAMSLIPFYRDKNIGFCISIEQCPEKGGYFFTTDRDKTCMSSITCAQNEPKGYAYDATKECSTQEPEIFGHFDTIRNNIYKCGFGHEYFDISETKTKCVTEKDCTTHGYIIVTETTKMCVNAE